MRGGIHTTATPFVQGRRTHQSAKHQGHTAGVVTRLAQHFHARAVRFLLGIARKPELTIDHGSLTKRCDAHRSLASTGNNRRQDRRSQGRQGKVTTLRLLGQASRNMSLRHVCDFVRHHSRKLRLAPRQDDQPGLHTNKAPWHGKRIDDRVSYTEHVYLRRTARRESGNFSTHFVQILTEIWVIDIFRIPATLHHDGLAQTTLYRRG